MIKLQHLPVRTKLALGFGAMLVFIVAVAAFAAYQLSLISNRSSQIADVHLAGVRDALLISESATRYRVREYRLAMTKPEEVPSVIKRMAQAVEAVDKHRKSYESSITGPEEQALYDAFSTAWSTYLATSGRMKNLLQAGDRDSALAIMTTDSLKHFDAVVAALKAMSEFNDQSAHAASDEAAQVAEDARQLIAAVVAAALVLGAWLSWAISRAVTVPLAHAVVLAEQVAAGDLTQALEDHRQDEVGRLTRALSRMVAQLRDVVGQVRHGVASVSEASGEIADGSHDLSSRTEQAAASLQQTASAMEELTGTMSHAADTAQQANQLASHAAGSAQRGGEVMARVVQNMGQITEASRKMSDIIGVIDSIAFQTNILALNAAVEAARAGEQGRGFAVVATEVRTLAQRSAQAAREIKGLIGASVETVDSGAGLVKEAGGVMQDIVASVQRVTDLMGELAAAASEQKTGMGQINIAVNQLDEMTQQNAALVEQTAAAASSLSEQAVRLNRVVSVFRTGGDADGTSAAVAAVPSPGPATARALKAPQVAASPGVATRAAARGVRPSAPRAPETAPPPAREPVETADWESF